MLYTRINNTHNLNKINTYTFPDTFKSVFVTMTYFTLKYVCVNCLMTLPIFETIYRRTMDKSNVEKRVIKHVVEGVVAPSRFQSGTTDENHEEHFSY